MSDFDDENPTPKRPLRLQSAEDRDLKSATRRRSGHPHGFPVLPQSSGGIERDPEEITSPYDLIERELSASELEVIRRSRRNGGDYATVADIVKLAETLTKERSENRQRAKDAEIILRSPHEVAEKLNAELEDVRADVRIVKDTVKTVNGALSAVKKWVLGSVAAAAAGVGTVSSSVLTKTEEHGGDKARIEQFRHDIDRLDGELRDVRVQLGRRSQLLDVGGSSSAMTASIKGQDK